MCHGRCIKPVSYLHDETHGLSKYLEFNHQTTLTLAPELKMLFSNQISKFHACIPLICLCDNLTKQIQFQLKTNTNAFWTKLPRTVCLVSQSPLTCLVSTPPAAPPPFAPPAPAPAALVPAPAPAPAHAPAPALASAVASASYSATALALASAATHA